ncbi:esterase/lipase family protein [Rossellomorea sp. NS-SX7]|uniref:esterase/lipase family protein n=1 Tax=Rossellomorea sp. NS-SX7 TaxID=3463856 RepID=UPI004059895A
MLKKVWMLAAAFFLLFPSLSMAGDFGKDDPSGVPGQWYVGTTPSYVAPSKHPVLFVHGLNSSSNTWWNDNNMYDTAYQNGYETSFIDLYPTKTMWDNGALLAGKIRDIYNYFGEKVVIVAHSKGGIDTQSALVHYGAYPYVARVITLSSPHSGSELADLAYSSWAGWLAGILGSKSDATYSLQTGYMSYFREQTDTHSNVGKVPFYTFAGTKWGSFGSSLYWGGLYLSSYGSNDGAVTVNSSRLPYAAHLGTSSWNHSTIKEGSSTFNLFKNYLNESTPASSGFGAGSTDSQTETASSYIRGGAYKGYKQETIFVEEGTEEVTIDWISSLKNTSLTLEDPDGKHTKIVHTTLEENGLFYGAYHHSLAIKSPKSGEWKIHANTLVEEDYLMNVTYDSEMNDSVIVQINSESIEVKEKRSGVKIKTDSTVDYYKDGKLKKAKIKIKDSTFKLPELGEGVYNVTIDIEGKKGKENFKRTMVKSIYVDSGGKMYFQ